MRTSRRLVAALAFGTALAVFALAVSAQSYYGGYGYGPYYPRPFYAPLPYYIPPPVLYAVPPPVYFVPPTISAFEPPPVMEPPPNRRALRRVAHHITAAPRSETPASLPATPPAPGPQRQVYPPESFEPRSPGN